MPSISLFLKGKEWSVIAVEEVGYVVGEDPLVEITKTCSYTKENT